jgi:menaquinone-dependent protoporphyrinogen oxidase
MRVLVTYGSKRGGTAGLAEMLGAALAAQDLRVDVQPAKEAMGVEGYDAVIVGGALYAGRWHRDARRFIKRHAKVLQSLPVWLFSSGPLDDSAARNELPPVAQVERLMNWIGAWGHKTFGGRLLPDAKGFIASMMAKHRSGDWRDPQLIRAWAEEIAEALRAGLPVQRRAWPRVEEQPPEAPIL